MLFDNVLMEPKFSKEASLRLLDRETGRTQLKDLTKEFLNPIEWLYSHLPHGTSFALHPRAPTPARPIKQR